MMLHKLAEWRDRALEEEAKKILDDNEYKPVQFRVIVTYDKKVGGYKVHGSINGSAGVWVSSQRNEVRVFKTLDNLAKLLNDFGIRYFEVVK